MRNTRKSWGLGAALVLAAGTLLATVTSTATAAPSAANACTQTPRVGHIAGIVAPQGNCLSNAAAINTSNAAKGTPPLIWHGGPVMMTPSTSPVVVTPIFWNPAGHSMSFGYKALLTIYLGDIALASGQNSNVFSVANEYFGSNGQIHYNIRLGFPINDTHSLPADGCTVASTDTAGIYADGTGYNACLDDDQLQAEIDSITGAFHMPRDLRHIYVLFLPKHVESCFFPGSTTTNANACTINFQPSAAYCAYHSFSNSSTVYSNMPFPIYGSKTGFTCSSDSKKNFGVVETPNNNPDADTEISPTSHELNESITDPDTNTGWYDSSGFENGDECAYVYGATQGTAGHLYNQNINGLHFLTQEEFSNNDFAITGGGCVQGASQEAH
jgi:hypothetical protein